MNTRSFERNRSDSGFTLPEVLITVVIIGLISTVLAGVFTVFMRSTPGAEARANDARSVLGLVTWLPQDVDSTPSTGFNVDPLTVSGCNQSPGVNLLRMVWSEKIGSVTTTFIANYRHVSDATAARVVRITCTGVGSPPFASGTEQNLTSNLPLLPVGWTQGDAPAAVNIIRTNPADPNAQVELVAFELTTFDGDIVRTDSASKNPAATLPTTTLPSWKPPTQTTNPGENTLPTAEHQEVIAWPAPATAKVNLAVNDIDGDPLVVAISSIPPGWVVSLVGLQMVITPVVAVVPTEGQIIYTVDDLRGPGTVTGQVSVKVVQTTETTTPAPTTTIPPKCAVISASLTPSSINNVNPEGGSSSVDSGVLFKKVIVEAVTNGSCIGLQIRYEPGNNSPGFLNLTKTGPTTWSGTLIGKAQGSSESWSDGPHELSFHDAAGGPYFSTILTIT